MRRDLTPRLSAVARGAIALLAGSALLPAFASTSGVVISQVYGGNGAVYDSDYVELFNASKDPVSITGWSVQYASATGTGTFASNGPTALNGTLQPGQYWLVKLATSATGAPLPAPDATGTTNISSSAGKLIVATTSTGLACNGGSTPCSADQLAQIVDLVGYGSANFFEGTPAPALTSTTALFRGTHGCDDTNVNGTDFSVGAPAPRNSATEPAVCDGGGGGGATPAAIYEIQGSGAKSPLVGVLVATQGVVTRVDNNGFFMQDQAGDNDPSTSDGIFVFTGSAPTVQAGQLVSLTGTVAEFNTGAASNTDTAAHTVTELTGVGNLQLLGNGTIAPIVVAMPLESEDAMEKYEGMLVTLQGPFTVQQNYFLGRYGELTLATGGRLQTPTNALRPGAEAQAMNADNIRRTILLDDGTTVQNPNPTPYLAADNTVRAGDTTPELTGVVDYGLTTSSNLDPGAYKIQPTATPTFARDNPRTTGVGKIKGANVRVASANVLNFFTTLNDGTNTCPPSNTASDCRGANSPEEFERQRTKIVEELVGLDADAVALMELQNNGNVAIQNLVDALNARLGTPAFAVVSDPPGGAGTDAIKVGIIYDTTRLKLIGAMSDTAAINNRAPVAATFKVLNNAVKFTLVANHLKSKGCDGATGADQDQGDLQGCWNARRVQQADELRSFVASVNAATGVSDTLLVGDFNAYAQEDPVFDLVSNGWVDQIGRYNSFGYSYVFNGTSGRLDHAFASASLSPKVMGAVEWHNNADEPSMLDYNLEFKQPACPTCEPDYYTPTPYRASDHDPIVLGLKMKKKLQLETRGDALTGSAGDDEIEVTGARTITGGGGRDSFVFASLRDAGGTITDFTPGDDDLDLHALLASLGASSRTALARGVVHLQAAGNDTVIEVNPTGAPGAARPLVRLSNVTPDRIDARRDLGLGHAKH